MSDMLEVRIHGRGGQGNVVAAYLLASAAITEGWNAQAFPAFGAERRGAPVVAFVRISEDPIRRRCQVATPDFLIIQDDALMHIPSITDGLKPGGKILLNSTRDAGVFTDALPRNTTVNDLLTLPATQLVQDYLGRPVPNTALLAAFLTLTGSIKQDSLKQSLTDRFKGNILDKNQRLVNAAANAVTQDLWAGVCHA